MNEFHFSVKGSAVTDQRTPGSRTALERDVLVVGAGPDGLMAARSLVAAGRSVAVLEARDRVGRSVYIAPDGTRHTCTGSMFPAGETTAAEMEKLVALRDGLVAEIGSTAPALPGLLPGALRDHRAARPGLAPARPRPAPPPVPRPVPRDGS